MTTFTLQDLTPAQLITDHINAPEVPKETKEALREILNTRSSNNLPTTPEEDEAMQALSEKQDAPVPQPSQVNPEALIEHMVAQFSTSLRLLLTTIISQPKAQPEPEAGTNVPSLQETVALVLQQGNWFKTMVYERAEELVDDKDFAYEIESAVETHFSNSFSLDDHVDISAEVESKVEDIAEDLLKDIVEDRLAEIVSNKLQNLRITFD